MFGAVDEDGNTAFSLIDDRTGQTLGQQIAACVKAGSLIRRCARVDASLFLSCLSLQKILTIMCSDCWKAYLTVTQLGLGYTHETVNHSIEFVSSQGVHTQRIESEWSVIKRAFKQRGNGRGPKTKYLSGSFSNEY
jgi:hypothetical protein